MLQELPIISTAEERIKSLLRNIDTLLYTEIDLYALCVKNFLNKKETA